jgi:hypothetical protein
VTMRAYAPGQASGYEPPPNPYQGLPAFEPLHAGVKTFSYPAPLTVLPGQQDDGDDAAPSRKRGDKSKRSKRHSKPHKKRNRKHENGAYVLQLIGVLCLVLAAVRCFEPLAGIGFTLVVIGYDSKVLTKGGLKGKLSQGSCCFGESNALQVLFARRLRRMIRRRDDIGGRRERKREMTPQTWRVKARAC